MSRTKADRARSNPAIDDKLADHSLAIITFLYNRVIAGAAPALRKRTGLSITEARVVFHVGAAPGTAANKLAKNLGLDKAAISRAVNRVIDLGLINSEKDPDHAARNKLYLTENGKELFGLISHFTFARENYLLSVLNEKEQAQFLASLQKIYQNVDNVNRRVEQGDFWG